MASRLTLSEAFQIFLRHASPPLLCIIMIAFLATRIFFFDESLALADLFALIGVMIYWPFQEWWMHRYILHLPPIKLLGKEHEFGFARDHRLHHADPTDIPLSFLPIPVILISLLVYTGIGYLITGSWAYSCSFMVGATSSTILYEWTHFLTHTNYKPVSAYYRSIWKLHRWHHYKHEGYWFSFTVPWLDGWFGTGPDVKDVAHSPTARDLRGSEVAKEVAKN